MKYFASCFLSIILLLGMGSLKSYAQQWDYLDVEQGYETLNLAIEGDTTAAGEPQSLNRVYRLKRGGTYLLNGYITNLKGVPLRIFAEDGDGPKPLIIPAVDESGASADIARLEADAHFKNLFISGIDMLGKQNRYCMAVYNEGTKVIWDGVEVDHSRQSHMRTYGTNTKLFFYNCIFSNSIDLASSGNGRFFDARGLMPDSLVFQNNTMYLNSQRMIRMDGAMIKNLILDHNTFYLNAFGSNTSSGAKQSGPLEIGKAINAKVTNNVFRDLAGEAMRHRKSIDPPDRIPVVYIDSLESADFPESSRNWLVKNNAYGWTSDFNTFWATVDTVKGPAFISPYGKTAFFNENNPNLIESNNFEELIEFTNAPTSEALLTYVKYRFSSNFTNVGNPDPRADANGIGSLADNPETFGPAATPYNFSYPTTQQAYTAGDGGYPLGDLNWFPDKKVQWEAEQGTGIERKDGTIINSFVLEQNFPNPFNPSTKINYTLNNPARVTVTVFNSMGQQVARLLNDQAQSVGKYSLTWDAKDVSGKQMSTGIYYYQLKTSDFQVTKKMLFVK